MYLLARMEKADELKLHRPNVRFLEKTILPNNKHMQLIHRLSKCEQGAPQADVRLEWHEGIEEVAAIVNNEGHEVRECPW